MQPFDYYKAFEKGTQIVTKLGWPVKIDGYLPKSNEGELIGWYKHPRRGWLACTWYTDGKFHVGESDFDLFLRC